MSEDHPLNRMSHSMLWGRSDLKEKFYSGSSQSNPWVRDLLWKKVIVEEKKKLNIPLVESVMGAPPFMRSVTMANMKAERELQRRRKVQLDAERAIEEQVARGMPDTGTGRSSRRNRPGTAMSGLGLQTSARRLRGSRSQPKLAPLNLEKMRRKNSGRDNRGDRSSRSRASSRAMSQASARSTYSRTTSVAS